MLRGAALVTPNADEAGALLGRAVRTELEGRKAAEDLVREGLRAVLVKGGHLASGERAVDWFATARTVVAITRPRRATPPLHGTGCTLSALIAGRLALRGERGAGSGDAVSGEAVSDDELLAAVRWARPVLDRALGAAIVVGRGARVLDVRPGARLVREVAR